jgi:hypothetical protein
VAGGTGRASADDPRATAARAYDKGSETFAHHEYGAAADWFELADSLAPDPLALEGAVKAHRKIGSPAHLARAGTLALRLRARAPGDAVAVHFADEALAALGPIFGRLTVRCGGCELALDGAAMDARDFFVAPGDHRLTARWPGTSAERAREETRTIHAVGGASETVEWGAPKGEPAPLATAVVPPSVALAPVSREAPPASSSSDSRTLSPAYALTGLGLTAALGAAAAVLWFAEAVPNGNQLTSEAQSTHRPDPSLQSRVDSQTHVTLALDVATGVVGAASLVTALFFTRWKGEASSAEKAASALGFTPGLAPVPGGGVASVGARF